MLFFTTYVLLIAQMITLTKGQVKENWQFKPPLFGIHLQWAKAHWGQQKQDDWVLLSQLSAILFWAYSKSTFMQGKSNS